MPLHAERGLKLYDSSSVSRVEGVAYCMLRLGTARLLAGDVEEAARLIGEAALLATKNRSARLTKAVQTARARLGPWRETRAVRELDERMGGVGL
jgi:hypothetical protein